MAKPDPNYVASQEQKQAGLGVKSEEAMTKLVAELRKQSDYTKQLAAATQGLKLEFIKGKYQLKTSEAGQGGMKGFLKEEFGPVKAFFDWQKNRKEGKTSVGGTLLTGALRGMSLGLAKFGLPGVAATVALNKWISDYKSYNLGVQAKREETQLALMRKLIETQETSIGDVNKILRKNGASEVEIATLDRKYNEDLYSRVSQLFEDGRENNLTTSEMVELLKKNNLAVEGMESLEANRIAREGMQAKMPKKGNAEERDKERIKEEDSEFLKWLKAEQARVGPSKLPAGKPQNMEGSIVSNWSTDTNIPVVEQTSEWHDQVLDQLKKDTEIALEAKEQEKDLAAKSERMTDIRHKQSKLKEVKPEDSKGGFFSGIVDTLKTTLGTALGAGGLKGAAGKLGGMKTSAANMLKGILPAISGMLPVLVPMLIIAIGAYLAKKAWDWSSGDAKEKIAKEQAKENEDYKKSQLNSTQIGTASKLGFYKAGMTQEEYSQGFQDSVKKRSASSEVKSVEAKKTKAVEDGVIEGKKDTQEFINAITKRTREAGDKASGGPLVIPESKKDTIKSNSDDMQLGFVAKGMAY